MKFTADQQKVIDLRNCNILVSAAAGSGKTAVLVERIIGLVSEADQGVDIDRLLVVTFTNAAAQQMRERLEQALFVRAQAEPENEHLQRQLLLLHNAQITTIDSFCLYLIRNHFNEIGLDPDFRIADEGERRLLCRDVLKELLEEKFAKKDPDFLQCVECFTATGQENRLEELILTLYAFSMSHPWPEEWLKQHRNDYAPEDCRQMEQTPWYRWMQAEVAKGLSFCEQKLQEMLRLCQEPAGPYMYLAALQEDLSQVRLLKRETGFFPEEGQDAGWDAKRLYDRMQDLSFSRLSAKKDDAVATEKREQVKAQRDKIKKRLLGMRETYFFSSPQQALQEMRQAKETLGALADLTLAFLDRFAQKKREKNLLDFSDMEHMALQILLVRAPDGTVTPSGTALEYREHYQEILIDEYQDSNLVQELLLQSISGEADGRFNRFMVGDVKQSIYKFRLARPELFMEKLRQYQKEGSSCIRVDLRQNFRSRTQVTDCVNDVFFRLMHEGIGGVEYDRDAALYPAAQYVEPKETGADPYEPEFLVALSEESGSAGRQQEARMVAARIREMVGKLPVFDKEKNCLRPARYRDIVILLRTASGWDETFKKALEEEGIPAHVTSRTGYFAAQEVQNILHFLHILNNPLQDIPLFGVLHSVIGGFTDEEIAMLRCKEEKRKQKLYDCLVWEAQSSGREALAEKCRAFLAFLDRFREYAVYLPIHSLIERFLEETGYLYWVSAMPGGNQRRLNVQMLLEKAESFEKTSYFGLFHFIRYLQQLEKYEVDYGEAGDLDENADLVRIMSIHKSKGLEFPICFVSGLSKRFNRQDIRQPLIVDMDLGLAIDHADPAQRTRRAVLKKNVMAQKLMQDGLGEELRVLYVAMTRAEEKLILTAHGKPDRVSFLPASEELMDAPGFFELLLPVWQESGRQVSLIDPKELEERKQVRTVLAGRLRQSLHASRPADSWDKNREKALEERIHTPYAHANLSRLFVKTTVSEQKKAAMQEAQEGSASLFPNEEAVPYLPRFIQERTETVSGALRGSACHRLLELFPFERKEDPGEWTIAQIQDVIEEKVKSRELTREYARVISPDKIRRFLQSDLARRMCAAQKKGRLFREQPFVLGIPASQIEEGLPEEETVLIQGIIDVFFEEDGKLVVVDYKTDVIKQEKDLADRYRVQLQYYAQALERLREKTVKEKILYSFFLGREIPL